MNVVIKNDDTNKSKDISTNNDNDMTFSHQIKSNLMELAENHDKIMILINSDKSMNDGIIIELSESDEYPSFGVLFLSC